MRYFGEELGATWLRDNSAHHKAQKQTPLCGSHVIVSDENCKEHGRKGVITKVAEASYKVTLKEWCGGEEFIYLDKWQFKIVE